MTGQTADRERVWTETQQWLDDLDRDDAGADFAAAPADLDDIGERLPTQQPPTGNDAELGHDELASATPDYDDAAAQADDTAVDLDGGDPAPAGGDVDDLDPAADRDDDPSPPAGPADTNPCDADDHTDIALNDHSAARPARYNRSIALGFAAATVVATLVVAGALMAMRSGPRTASPDHSAGPSTQVSVAAAPTTTGPGSTNTDSPIPYTATAVGCLPGSTAAQSVSGPDSTQAWVCVHGGNIGQYLVLNLGATMVITAVSITPGWVGTDPSGADQWQQHRILTRVQWSFNDTPPTVVPQDTGTVHGDAVKPMPDHGVLASRVIMLVQETGRAPADTAPTPSAGPAPGGLFDGVLGPPPLPAEPPPASTTRALPGLPDDQSRTDPADNTFAVSSIKIFGHPPQ
jgi:hypothetical protein